MACARQQPRVWQMPDAALTRSGHSLATAQRGLSSPTSVHVTRSASLGRHSTCSWVQNKMCLILCPTCHPGWTKRELSSESATTKYLGWHSKQDSHVKPPRPPHQNAGAGPTVPRSQGASVLL